MDEDCDHAFHVFSVEVKEKRGDIKRGLFWSDSNLQIKYLAFFKRHQRAKNSTILSTAFSSPVQVSINLLSTKPLSERQVPIFERNERQNDRLHIIGLPFNHIPSQQPNTPITLLRITPAKHNIIRKPQLHTPTN